MHKAIVRQNCICLVWFNNLIETRLRECINSNAAGFAYGLNVIVKFNYMDYTYIDWHCEMFSLNFCRQKRIGSQEKNEWMARIITFSKTLRMAGKNVQLTTLHFRVPTIKWRHFACQTLASFNQNIHNAIWSLRKLLNLMSFGFQKNTINKKTSISCI